MKKIVLSSIVAASLAVSSFAVDSDASSSKSSLYVGFGYSTLTGTHTIPYTVDLTSYYNSYGYSDASSEDEIDDVDADASTLKIGLDNKTYRLEVSYTSIKTEGTANLYSGFTAYNNGTTNISKESTSFDEKFTGFDLDFIVPFTENAFKPYIAFGLGYYSWEDYKVTTTSSETRDRGALAYNLGAGLLYSFGMVELDVAYKWKQLNWEDVTEKQYSSSTYSYLGDREIVDEKTTLSGLYVGVNFHF